MSSTPDFWSRRRAAVQAEEEAEARAQLTRPEIAQQSENEVRDDAQILSELDLPDPDDLILGDDIRGFMSRAVPEHLRRRALRKLWRLNPVLANMDGLVDYGEDYTDSATVVETLRTTYQVGKGMLAHLQQADCDTGTEPDEEDGRECSGGDAGQNALEPAETVAEAPLAPAPEVLVAGATPDTALAPVTPRRMRFEFSEPRAVAAADNPRI